jgi:hypothetical protein
VRNSFWRTGCIHGPGKLGKHAPARLAAQLAEHDRRTGSGTLDRLAQLEAFCGRKNCSAECKVGQVNQPGSERSCLDGTLRQRFFIGVRRIGADRRLSIGLS